MHTKLNILFFLLSLNHFTQAQIQTGQNTAIVQTQSGKVRGYIHAGISTFKGIPYAEAKRFEAAHAPKPWTNVRSSMGYGPVAPLMDATTSVDDESEFVFDHSWGFTNEDCLRINIWSPMKEGDGKKRPVLFWIHGGGFVAGSSQELASYDGENMAKNGDVVVVSINHRLNILGFLDLSAYSPKYKQSANLSILDLKIALEWVRDNISNFGGDVNNVTIFGQSGGGAKVNTLMAMPSAKGLFHKAINQSGSFRMQMLEKNTTQAIAVEVLNELHLEANQVDSIQNIPFETLSAAGKKALKTIEAKIKADGKSVSNFGLGWGPSVEETVLPYQLFSKEAFELSKNIPLMLGTTKNEFTPFFNGYIEDISLEKAKEIIEKQHPGKTNEYIAAIKKAYPNDSKPSDLLSMDNMFRPGAVLQAVFDNILRCEEMTGGSKQAHVLAKKISQAWINFAKNGNPNHKGLPNWPAYNAQNTATMHFDNKCFVSPQRDKEFLEMVK
jgi:para-nitrobenzyl esterase